MQTEGAESGECQARYRVRSSNQRRGVEGQGEAKTLTYSGRWQDLG